MVALLCFTYLGVLLLGRELREYKVDRQRAKISALEQRVVLLQDEIQFWQRSARAAQETLLRSRKRIVEVSAYTASKEECDADPQVAASMQPPKPGTVAVSRDLFDMGWTFGKKVYLKGMGPYIINDVMNHRHQMRVDVFMDHKRAAKEFGVRTTEAILL
jgi:3D (Asp-Asp-Asp) domain-containing protein